MKNKNKIYNLLITGSRKGHSLFTRTIRRFIDQQGKPYMMILGCAKGVDRRALEYCCDNDIFFVVHTADWSLGKKAGYIRNQSMVDCAVSNPDIEALGLGFPIGGSPGTRQCIKLAEKAGILIEIIEGVV